MGPAGGGQTGRRTRREVWPEHSAPRQPRAARPSLTIPTPARNHQDTITDLFSELETLNNLVNLKGMLAAVRALNNLMKNCGTSTEKIYTFITFAK